jgi:hypothetical protein
VAAQASLDDAIIGDPITLPVALAAILDFFAGQLAVPPDADDAVTVLQGVQVHMMTGCHHLFNTCPGLRSTAGAP